MEPVHVFGGSLGPGGPWLRGRARSSSPGRVGAGLSIPIYKWEEHVPPGGVACWALGEL